MLAPANPTLASKYHLCLSKEHEAALGFPPPSSTPVAAPLGGAPVNLGYPPLYAPRPSASGSSIQAGTGGAAFSAAQRELDAVKQQKEALERQLAALDAEKAEKAAEEQRVQETAAKEALELEKARSDAGRAEKQEAGLRSHLEKVLRELAEVDAVPSSRRDYWVSKVSSFAMIRRLAKRPFDMFNACSSSPTRSTRRRRTWQSSSPHSSRRLRRPGPTSSSRMQRPTSIASSTSRSRPPPCLVCPALPPRLLHVPPSTTTARGRRLPLPSLRIQRAARGQRRCRRARAHTHWQVRRKVTRRLRRALPTVAAATGSQSARPHPLMLLARSLTTSAGTRAHNQRSAARRRAMVGPQTAQ